MDAVVRKVSTPNIGLKADTDQNRFNPDITDLDFAVANACNALMSQQKPDGDWCYELEADCTISAEYIIMMHFMDEIDELLQAKIANYLRSHQQSDGSYLLYPEGPFDLSCTVKVYFALKLAGDNINADHMVRARNIILAHGGAALSNVFTRILLAMFGEVPWRAAPVVPIEILLQPRWSPFHISKISYWSRAVVVPLAILCSLKAKAKNPLNVDIQELFPVAADKHKNYFPTDTLLKRLFIWVDSGLRLAEHIVPNWIRKHAIAKGEAWFIERLGEGGLGAIFPAMVNSYEALALLGYAADHPYRVKTKKAIEDLLVINEQSAYCQPCVSPVWDTALACLALQEADHDGTLNKVETALDWFVDRQLTDQPGDWRDSRPALEGGGWPFQYHNDHYPDLDDTSVVAWAMGNAITHSSKNDRYVASFEKAANWLQGMQSRNGGFASFDVDNQYEYLNQIPFADHGALLDPPTADVSARCLAVFSMLESMLEKEGNTKYQSTSKRCLAFLQQEQEQNGSWFGRWGTNYIYGTWSVLAALEIAGIPKSDPMVQRAVQWLKSKQRADGGWGESNDSYFDAATAGENKSSTAFQTAWAMLGLMAAGEELSPELRRAAAYLIRIQRDDNLWHDEGFTAPGFPRVFHLKYHAYDKIFPLWALARYRNIKKNGA